MLCSCMQLVSASNTHPPKMSTASLYPYTSTGFFHGVSALIIFRKSVCASVKGTHPVYRKKLKIFSLMMKSLSPTSGSLTLFQKYLIIESSTFCALAKSTYSSCWIGCRSSGCFHPGFITATPSISITIYLVPNYE